MAAQAQYSKAHSERLQSAAGQLVILPRSSLCRKLGVIAKHSRLHNKSVVITLGAQLGAHRAAVPDEADSSNHAATFSDGESDAEYSSQDDDSDSGPALSTLVFSYADERSIAQNMRHVSSRLKGLAGPSRRRDLSQSQTEGVLAQYPAMQHLHHTALHRGGTSGAVDVTCAFSFADTFSSVNVTFTSHTEQVRRQLHREAAVVDSLSAEATVDASSGKLLWDVKLDVKGMDVCHAFSDAADSVARTAPIAAADLGGLQLLPRKTNSSSTSAGGALHRGDIWTSSEAAAVLEQSVNAAEVEKMRQRLLEWLEHCDSDTANTQQCILRAVMRVGGMRVCGAALRNILIEAPIGDFEVYLTEECEQATAAATAAAASSASGARAKAAEVTVDKLLQSIAEQVCAMVNTDGANKHGVCKLKVADAADNSAKRAAKTDLKITPPVFLRVYRGPDTNTHLQVCQYKLSYQGQA
jgi:hypothetical protein